MGLTYRLTPLPPTWPGKRTPNPKRSPFKTRWTRTLAILERELRHLRARDVEIAVDVRSPRDIRADGMLRADARPRHPVILAFTIPAVTTWERGQHVVQEPERRLQFPCDTYGWWEDNVYAIACALENLRAVERWGVSRTSQYEGFKAIPATTGTTLNTASAAAVLATRSGGLAASSVLADRSVAQAAYRTASARTHPDRGGNAADFHLVQEAKRVLEAHFGGAL